jgi:CBS domain containing-hemolysin-like protein
MLATTLVVLGAPAAFAQQTAISQAQDNDVQIANNDNKQVNKAKIEQKVGSSTGDKNKIFNLGGAGDNNTATATVTQGNTATNTAVNDDSGDTVTSSASNCASLSAINLANCLNLSVGSTVTVDLGGLLG